MPLKTLNREYATPRKGRGAGINPEGRFEKVTREAYDDGWGPPDREPSTNQLSVAPAQAGAQRNQKFLDSGLRRNDVFQDIRSDSNDKLSPLKTFVTVEQAKSIISRNDSPDIPFTQSINPYRGCEHGCIYCYSRPSHAYLNLSPGIDFETRLFAKVNAAELLRKELAQPGYQCDVISLGANTDPYQPIEREYRITRGILEVLAECEHPVGIVTKSAMVERDIDILAAMAQKNLVNVFVSLNNLDHDLARRLEAMRRLSAAGIPVGVLVAPVIPFLTDHQIEPVLEAAYAAGARCTGYVLMRLPWEVKDLFKDWLDTHYPLKAKHVMSRVHQMRSGRDNDPDFGSRMRGSGEFADLLRKRFDIACERFGYNAQKRNRTLDTTRFRRPQLNGQMALF